MARKTQGEERQVVLDREEVAEMRTRIDRLEGRLRAIEDGLEWKPVGHCTECQEGWLVRNGSALRCTSCGYWSE